MVEDKISLHFVSQNTWLAKKLAFPYCIRDLLKLIKIFKVFNNIELYKNVSVKQMKNLFICDISMQSHAECSTQLLAIFNFSSSDFLLINAFLFESACLTAHWDACLMFNVPPVIRPIKNVLGYVSEDVLMMVDSSYFVESQKLYRNCYLIQGRSDEQFWKYFD